MNDLEISGDVVVDETDLDPTDEAGGVVTANFGGDGLGGFMATDASSFGFTGQAGADLTSGGEPVVVTLEGGVYIGRADGEDIFTLDIEADGTYTFTLIGQLDHADTSDPNDVIELTFGVKATDADGDSASGDITVTGVG